MFSGGILSQQSVGSKRNRESFNSYRQPQYGRSGLLARAADEERMATVAAQNQRRTNKLKMVGEERIGTDPSHLSKFIPSPFVVTPMLLTGGITSSVKRLISDEMGSLQAQLKVLMDEGNGARSAREHESALEVTRRRMVERFLVKNEKDGVLTEIFDEKSSSDASEALCIFNESVVNEVKRIKKRLDILHHQLHSKGNSSLRKEAVALFPTSYLQGLLHHYNFMEEAANAVVTESVVCAKEAAAAACRGNSILPLPAMARRMMGEQVETQTAIEDKIKTIDRPDPKQVAKETFQYFLATSVKSIDTEFTRVELPLNMTVEELDAAEAKQHLADSEDYTQSDNYIQGITTQSHTVLTKSIQIVVLKDGKPLEGIRPIPALHLIGEKFYDGNLQSSGSTKRFHEDPLAAFGMSGDRGFKNLGLKAKYRFHLLPFPDQSSQMGPGEKSFNEVSVDTVAIFGRNADQSTVLTEHPSCSGQHLAMYWSLAFTKTPDANSERPHGLPLPVSETQWFLELQIADLGASNGSTLIGGGAATRLPKTPIQISEISSEELAVVQTESKKKVMKVSCPFREQPEGSHTFNFSNDVGFGPLGSAGFSLLDGDEIAIGASTRRYAVVYDNEGISTKIS